MKLAFWTKRALNIDAQKWMPFQFDDGFIPPLRIETSIRKYNECPTGGQKPSKLFQ
jgi:hypothetical protein